MLSAPVRTAADFDVERARHVDQRRRAAQVLLDRLSESSRLRHGELARFGAGAAGHVGDRIGVRQAEAGGLQRSKERGHVAASYPPEHQVLNGGDAHGAIAVRAREIREHPELRAAEVAERHGDGRGNKLLLLLSRRRSCVATSTNAASSSIWHAFAAPARCRDRSATPGQPCGRSRQSMARAGAPNRARLRIRKARLEFQRPPAFGANQPRARRRMPRETLPIPST